MPIRPRSSKVVETTTAKPVSIQEVRDTLNLSTTMHNSSISRTINAARIKIEHDTRRSLVRQVIVTKWDKFPTFEDFLELPRPPFLKAATSTTSFVYLGSTGNVTVGSTTYRLDLNDDPGSVYLKQGETWPTPIDERNAVVFTGVHGYSTAADNVPEDAKQAILMLCDDWLCHSGIDGPANRDNYNSLISTLRWEHYR